MRQQHVHYKPPYAASFKTLFLVLFSSFYILRLTVLSFLLSTWITASMLMTLNSSLSILVILIRTSLIYIMHWNTSLLGWLSISSLLNSSKREFLLIGNKQQHTKIHNTSLHSSHSACNLGFIFDEHLTLSDQISALFKSCNSHIRQLRCIRPYLDLKTASTVTTSIVHSKLDYCNSLYFNISKSQINRLQRIQDCLARTIVNSDWR